MAAVSGVGGAAWVVLEALDGVETGAGVIGNDEGAAAAAAGVVLTPKYDESKLMAADKLMLAAGALGLCWFTC